MEVNQPLAGTVIVLHPRDSSPEEVAILREKGAAVVHSYEPPTGVRVFFGTAAKVARLEAAVRDFRRIAAERVNHYREEEMPNAERAWQEIVDYADAALKEDA